MKDEPEGVGRRPAAVGDAHRGDESRALAVGDHLRVALDHVWGWRGLADCGCSGSQSETTGQRGAAFQEFPSSRLFRAHGASLLDESGGKSLPAGGSIRPLERDAGERDECQTERGRMFWLWWKTLSGS